MNPLYALMAVVFALGYAAGLLTHWWITRPPSPYQDMDKVQACRPRRRAWQENDRN